MINVADNQTKLKGSNAGVIIREVQERHPSLSDETKAVLSMTKSGGLFGLFK